ncbi:MAG: ABC transporter ATP-binding protein [Candidatus Kariarchaeaceae archaeon]
MSKSEYILECNDVHKVYGEGTQNEVHALQGINLKIKRGEMVAIQGPSGCGKSTLLNVIGGLTPISQGEIFINGIDIRDFSDAEMATFRNVNLSYIFQLFNLFPFLTSLQNVILPLLIQQLPRSIAESKSISLLREMGLGGQIIRRPGELSGGQQQRVAIARALVSNPQILLGDEPTGDLDTTTSGDILRLFRRINTEKEQTMVLVTHSNWIASKCDRIIRIQDGVIVEDGLNGGK